MTRVIVDAHAYHKFFDVPLLDDDNKSDADAEDEILEVQTEAQKQADDDRRDPIKPFAEEYYLLSTQLTRASILKIASSVSSSLVAPLKPSSMMVLTTSSCSTRARSKRP